VRIRVEGLAGSEAENIEAESIEAESIEAPLIEGFLQYTLLQVRYIDRFVTVMLRKGFIRPARIGNAWAWKR
jgi:hypothetical protein